MKPPLFSIIIPTFNCLTKLKSTVTSILEQDFKDFECLVIDARSTDGTREYATELSGADSRVQIFSDKDQNIFDAMNKGIRYARGQYLYFIGAGDCLTSNILSRVADHLSALPKDRPIFLYGDVYWINRALRYDGIFDSYRLSEINICHQGIFYDRRIFTIVGNYELSYFVCADWALNIKTFGNPRIAAIYMDAVIANYEGGGNSDRRFDPDFARDRSIMVLKYLGLMPFLRLLGSKVYNPLKATTVGRFLSQSRFGFLLRNSRFYKYFHNMFVKKRAGGSLADNYETVFESVLHKSPYFRDETHPELKETVLKPIAFYLPQFHPIPENDTWWGKGFTEWTNVTKSLPQYVGHYQPHLPGELGFYDLCHPEVLKRQMELARQYGIHGFCFYHYWFSRKRLLEKPVDLVLNNPALNLPFCLCWANENWTRRWDGKAREVLIAQEHSEDDDIAFIKDISRAFKDPRYIRVNGKPLLLVYNILLLPDPARTARLWREYCTGNGIEEIYLVAAQIDGLQNPSSYGFDASVEFPPHNIAFREVSVPLLNPRFNGSVNLYADLIQRERTLQHPEYPLFKTVFPGWDNSARRVGRGKIFHQSTPDLFSEWLDLVCRQTMDTLSSNDEKLVFINAWNEWAEGAHLEPDRRFGYAYLEATAKILNKYAA